MKKTTYYFVLLSIFLTSTTSCKKKNPDVVLPTGENTMYYYVDGELYIPEDSTNGGQFSPAINHSICDIDSPTFDINTNNLHIHFYQGLNDIGVIVLNQGSYDSCYVNDYHASYYAWDVPNGDSLGSRYLTHDGSGSINITYLSDNKKHFKGTFEMTVYHESTGAEKYITDGHFDINLDTL